MLRALALCGLMLTSACATITTGGTQPITVTSDPAGASCQLQREGAVVGAVNPTPGTVTVSRSTRDITVRCEREGRQPGLTALPAGFQPMTLGNILVGGVIGIAVDAASGAMGQYPPNVHVALPPAVTAEAPSRDGWFEQRRREILAQAEARVAAVRRSCRPTPGATGPDTCEMEAQGVLLQRDAELRLLDEQRAGRSS